MEPSKKLTELAKKYRDTQIEFPRLKAVTLASWILESGWGGSELAERYNNFAGMKYRDAIKKYASKVRYKAHDGEADYCAFKTLDSAVSGTGASREHGEFETFILSVRPQAWRRV